MKLYGTVNILGKVEKPWTDTTGAEHISYSMNIMQENGQIIDTLRVSKEQFNTVEAGKPYVFHAEYGVGKNGSYLRVLGFSTEK